MTITEEAAAAIDGAIAKLRTRIELLESENLRLTRENDQLWDGVHTRDDALTLMNRKLDESNEAATELQQMLSRAYEVSA